MKKILVIDDEENFCSLVKLNLEHSTGWAVTTATNGAEGLSLARSLKPDIILLDLLMPDMSGYDVRRSLKSDPETKNIPIILLTALNVEESEIISQDCVDDYVVKPASVKKLKETIEKILGVVDKDNSGRNGSS
ncbi:MAG TPA: response regulator [Candidatus Omnitrophota bacterium]|nr:response regulator [Candidatus Omnitrophota bacterium]HPT07141.1 response regulator [Candidatus Omnitrophota bacterium]